MDLAGNIGTFAIIGGAVLIFMMTAYFVLFMNAGSSKVHNRAEKLMEQYSKATGVKGHAQTSVSLKKIDKDMRLHGSIRMLPSISRLRQRLDQTGKEISVGQYFKWNVIYTIVPFLAFYFGFGMMPILAVLLSIFLGLMIPHMRVSRMTAKRMKRFLLLFPDALDLMIRGLRSGLPVTESINVIKDEIQEPIKSIFAEISQSVRIGVPFEEALMNMARKLGINEFNFFVISIALQRETGGNLAEILENLSQTIRARATMKLKIRALTSEARMSSYIVGSLPFFVSFALMFMSPGYLNLLFEDVRGNIALACAMTSFTFGMFIMRKMGKFEI